MSPATAMLFDMDGTMVDSMPVHAKSWEAFARRHGIGLGVAEILRRLVIGLALLLHGQGHRR